MEKDEKFAALRTANAKAQEHVVALEAELRRTRTGAEAAEQVRKFADENRAIQEALAAEPSLVAPLSELLRGVPLDPALLARVTALDEASATKDKNGRAAATSQPSEFWQQLLDDDSIAEGEANSIGPVTRLLVDLS